MRAGTALSGLNTRLKLKNRIEMNNVDLIKDEINYDTN